MNRDLVWPYLNTLSKMAQENPHVPIERLRPFAHKMTRFNMLADWLMFKQVFFPAHGIPLNERKGA